mmetsp:Transcript_20964/g.41863  ORF Transcript_20964/g.41863 Transcript_20964/m.41863 type:complete len:91 (+) Transcript_20964:1194-1466(+)
MKKAVGCVRERLFSLSCGNRFFIQSESLKQWRYAAAIPVHAHTDKLFYFDIASFITHSFSSLRAYKKISKHGEGPALVLYCIDGIQETAL